MSSGSAPPWLQRVVWLSRKPPNSDRYPDDANVIVIVYFNLPIQMWEESLGVFITQQSLTLLPGLDKKKKGWGVGGGGGGWLYKKAINTQRPPQSICSDSFSVPFPSSVLQFHQYSLFKTFLYIPLFVLCVQSLKYCRLASNGFFVFSFPLLSFLSALVKLYLDYMHMTPLGCSLLR